MTKFPLSVIIITRNEEHNIAACLESVAWADDLVVVDAQSVDETVNIARRFTGKVFVTEWLGFSGAKTFALANAVREWVLWLDADERVTGELAKEIQSILNTPNVPHNGFEVARRAYFLGRWIRHCGWYPGYVARLFRKEYVRFTSSRVHERTEVDGTIGRLKNDLIHYTDVNLHHYFSKFNRYTTLAAMDGMEGKKTFRTRDVILRPPFLFFKMFILRGGFLDGMQGLILSLASAAYVFTKYAKLWERHVDRVDFKS